MRKRLVIGAVAAVVIGVGAYLVWKPAKGTVAYHKKKYLEAQALGPVGEWINFNARPLLDLYWMPKNAQIDFHRNALLEAGYFAQREFVLSNLQTAAAINQIANLRVGLFTDWTNDPAGIPVLWLDPREKKLKVIARFIDIAKWEDAIRKADVPETK